MFGERLKPGKNTLFTRLDRICSLTSSSKTHKSIGNPFPANRSAKAVPQLEQAVLAGFQRFSFGRSTNADGWTENRALLRFKAGFGAGLASQFHIELPLDRLAGLRE